jgi:heat shock protein HslJ
MRIVIFFVAALALLAEPFLTYALAGEPVQREEEQAGTAPDLSGTVWQWQQTLMNNDDKLVPDNPANYTVQFMADGTVSGSAGCNRYNAGYQVDGNGISIGLPIATRRFCAEPEGIMEQEQEYLTALGTAATYRMTGGRMEMRTAEGSIVATFEAAKR